jgi:hypothetical protein
MFEEGVMRTLPAALIILLVIGAPVACSGGQETTQTAGSTSADETATAPTTTEEPPLSAKELAWWHAVKRYGKRFQNEWQRSGITLTQSVMQRWSTLFAECAKTLRKAGDPGRYAEVENVVDRACNRLRKAKEQLAVAIASSDAGGAVIAGTPEEERFNKALNRTTELVGNALNDFVTARQKARAVEAEFGT